MMDEKVSKEYENDQSENKIAEDTEATVTFKVTIPEEETEVVPEEKAEEAKEENDSSIKRITFLSHIPPSK